MSIASVSLSPAAAPTTARPLWATAVEDVRDLAGHAAAWEALAAAAVEANVFYEPWMLLPALEAFAAGARLVFVLVWGPDPDAPQGPPLLHGFFPLERQGRWRKLPVAVARLWRHPHCYLCTPLVRAGRAAECLTTFLRWLHDDPRGAALLEGGVLSADGPFLTLLGESLERHGRPRFTPETTTRAVWRPRRVGDPDRPVALSGARRRTLERKQRRLAETGRLEYRVLPPEGDVRAWIDAFLHLEGTTWKGRAGTALACSETDRRFFTAAATAAFERGRLLAHGLYLDDRPLALRCSFLAGDGAFAFKTAYDEAYRRFSPGVLLELDNLRRLRDQSAIRWMDSCTTADNFVINGLWDDRRSLQSLTASTGRWTGDVLAGLLPGLTRLKRTLFPRPAPPAAGKDAPAAEEDS